MPFWKKYPKNKIEDDPKVMEDVYAGPEMDEPEEPEDEAPKKKKKTRESMEAVYAGPPADEPMSRVYAGPEQMRRGGVMKAVYAAPVMTQPQPSPMMMVYAGPQQMAGMNGTAGMPGIMIPLPRADRFEGCADATAAIISAVEELIAYIRGDYYELAPTIIGIGQYPGGAELYAREIDTYISCNETRENNQSAATRSSPAPRPRCSRSRAGWVTRAASWRSCARFRPTRATCSRHPRRCRSA